MNKILEIIMNILLFIPRHFCGILGVAILVGILFILYKVYDFLILIKNFRNTFRDNNRNTICKLVSIINFMESLIGQDSCNVIERFHDGTNHPDDPPFPENNSGSNPNNATNSAASAVANVAANAVSSGLNIAENVAGSVSNATNIAGNVAGSVSNLANTASNVLENGSLGINTEVDISIDHFEEKFTSIRNDILSILNTFRELVHSLHFSIHNTIG